MTLSVGTPAPVFCLPAAPAGAEISLGDFSGKFLVLVFYPKDSTPGCTRQLCALRDDLTQFQANNTAIIASNPGSLKSHAGFIEKQSYPFPILVDADKAMAQAYEALKPEGGIQRTVYVINPHGTIIFAQQGTPSIAELLAAISS